MGYILGIDQSTQGTKAILTDENGRMVGRADRPHRQIINSQGWVSHDLEEIYQSVIASAKDVVERTGICKEDICAVGISNQRETTAIWNRQGQPLNLAVVWQCARAKEIAHQKKAYGEQIEKKTGLPLSPYFPAAKMAWLLQNTEDLPDTAEICLGTIDSWLIYRLTNGEQWKTDYSNASRTQLFDLHTLQWSEEICRIFDIPVECLPTVCDSNSLFGMTDLDGLLPNKVPIHSAMGDSHAALFGQGCHSCGMIKTTYGTGSSIMMNTGENCIASRHGLATSLAWGIDGKVNYVLEGNINYTGAVITWLKDDLQLIQSPGETEAAAKAANPQDRTVLVPAFSGLSAPYWNDEAKGMLYGMTRTTGRNEIIRAALDSIVLQIQAVLDAMNKDSGLTIQELGADGGPTQNGYLMQRQSDISQLTVAISDVEELSALGAAYLAGISVGLYEKEKLFAQRQKVRYTPKMPEEERQHKLKDWNRAVELLLR
ncbi:FGGY-family carbohydrate kinase [Candidatus Agathobaculum pullicola]|uniref:FGGY-family carbohydrate kinase n=1 Tax=Candidatus Agathobaculum pullicola TaxID=2838426 RepID=UPI003F93887C